MHLGQSKPVFGHTAVNGVRVGEVVCVSMSKEGCRRGRGGGGQSLVLGGYSIVKSKLLFGHIAVNGVRLGDVVCRGILGEQKQGQIIHLGQRHMQTDNRNRGKPCIWVTASLSWATLPSMGIV
jgi:hypothetical protein